MAIFKNPPPQGFLYPTLSEKQFVNILQDLPSKWVFWYEPVIHGGQTPDFVIWVPAEEFASIFLIELKNWRRSYVSRADMTYVYLRNNRMEQNPISKLKTVRNNLNEALTMHFRSAPGLENVAVIPMLAHWGIEKKDSHQLLQNDPDVSVIGKSIVQSPDNLCLEMIQQAKRFYEFLGEEPPVISAGIKRSILSCVDLSIRAHAASGKFSQNGHANGHIKRKAKHQNGAAPEKPKAINYAKPVSLILDDFQQAAVNNRSLGHCLLSGVPGTGKTIILLGRMRWYARHRPREKQLFIVHQKVLITNLKQRYRYQFNDGKSDKNIHFFRFKDWFVKTYDIVPQKLRLPAHKQSQVMDTLVDDALAGKLPIRAKAVKRFGHIFVDESHQMPSKWLKLLARYAKKHQGKKPNIWFAYDNGQGIYKNRRFEGHTVGLNFQGRAKNFQRVYRCGLLPWVFAACCHPEAFRTYRSRNSGEYLEFTHLGEQPLAIVQPTLEEQALRTAAAIQKRVDNQEIKLSDVTIFYAVAGMSERDVYPEQETKATLDRAFADLNGIEWVAINKATADWTSDRVRACTFTSSQGIDAPVSVLFGAESFKMFTNSDWVDPDALFYTVLTRSTDHIILTYNDLNGQNGCKFQASLFRGIKKASKILPKLQQLKPVKAEDDTEVYRIKWSKLDEFINS